MGEILYYICIFPLEQVLEFFLMRLSKISLSYGMGIIYLSLLVNLFLLKISLYTDRKAKAEAALKAKLDSRIKAWKSVYKRAKLYAFTQTLYRQHNYHPIYALRSLGGFLMQIPFFIAMIHLVENAGYLQEVRFLWIDDLSKPDSITLLGFSIHLLPILMTLFTLINVFYSSKELGARIQGSVIALLFLVLLYSMPSALVLYWTCNMVFALVKEVIKARFGNSSLTQSLREYQKNASVTTDKVAPSHFFSQPTNLTQDTRIAESQKLNSHSSLRGSEANVAIHNNLGKATNPHFQINNTESKLDSKQMDCHADKSARNDELASMDCRNTNRQTHNSANTSANNGGTFAKLLNAIFTPHNALTPKDYKLYRNISILAILNICFMICVFSPYAVYSSDVSQFDVNQTYQTLGALFGVFLTSSLIIIYLTSFFYKSRLLKLGTWGFSAYLILCVVYAFFLMKNIFNGLPYAQIDGLLFQDGGANISHPMAKYFDPPFALFLMFATIVILRFYKKLFYKAVLCLSLVLCISSIIDTTTIISQHAKFEPKSTKDNPKISSTETKIPDTTPFLSFSKEKNILVIMSDTVQSDNFTQAILDYPEFRDVFEGFTYYPNSLSVGSITFASMASIVGGEHYAPHNVNKRSPQHSLAIENSQAFIDTANAFHTAGYHVSLATLYPSDENTTMKGLNKNIFVAPPHLGANFVSFYKQAFNIEDIESKNALPLGDLLSFGLFKVSPYVLRSKIYQSEGWVFGNSLLNNHYRYSVSNASRLTSYSKLSNTNATQHTFKFINEDTEHFPWLLDNKNNCKPISSHSEYRSRIISDKDGLAYSNHICYLKNLAMWLEWFKKEGIYDQTKIIIVSDHGNSGNGAPLIDFPRRELRNSHVLVLVKDFNAKGKLKIDRETFVSNSDAMAFACDEINSKCPNIKPSILKAPQKDRELIFNVVDGGTGRQSNNTYNIIMSYKVKNNIFDLSNWQDITESVKNGTFKIDGINH